MNDYRSFGSNYYQSSQTRKISIGIMADSQPKRNPGDAEKLKSATVIDIQTIKKEKVTDVTTKQKNPAQVMTSPWRSPKPTYRKLGTLENVLSKQQTSSFSGSKGLNNGVNRANQPPAFDSFQNFPQHCNGGRNEKVMDKTPEKKMEEEPEKVVVASMDKQEKDKTGSTDALRSKLWEILGKPSPANNQEEDVVVNSETPETQEVEKKKNKKKTNFNLSQEKGPVIKPRHNEDTIETDSESPENTTKRPVTRSLLRRGKGTQKKTKACGNNLTRKCAEEVNNIFTFEGEKTGTTPAVKPSVTPKKPRGRRKNTVVQCRKETSKSKSKTPSSFESSGTGKRSSSSSSHEVYQQSKTRKQKVDNNTREEEEFHQSPEAETIATAKPGMKFNELSKNSDKQEKPSNIEQENDLQSPTFGYKAPISSPSSPCSSPEATTTKPVMFNGLSKNSDKPGMKFNGLSKNSDKQEKPSNIEPENDLQSPTFGYKAPISSPSPCSSPEASPSPLPPRNMNPSFDETETPIFSFGIKKPTQETKGQASDSEKKLPDFLEKKREYSFGRESSAEPDEDLVLSDPSSDEKDSEEEEDSPALKHYKSPEEKSTKKSNLKAKRNSNLKGKQKKPDAFQKFSEIDDEDDDEGLGRAIGLFAMALQNYEKKLKSAAEKKSSEIIASVSEEIHQELENVKSHIITEAGKTSNVAKTKRKHAETRLQEQQEKMRMIHEKFKDDVGNHLEEFKNTIEGLETNHSELKGTIKKQKTSHQKLIAQFEGGIERKLDDATKRINSVNKSAKGKMLQLKMIVAECLNDDVL